MKVLRDARMDWMEAATRSVPTEAATQNFSPRELASPLRGDERKMILGIFPAAVGEPPTGSLLCSLAAPGYLELSSGSSGIAPRLASFGTQTPLPSEIAFMQSWWRRK